MPPKVDGKKAAKPKINLAVELQYDQDLKKLLEGFAKLRCPLECVQALLKRAKSELTKIKDGEQFDVNFLPLLVVDPMPYETCRGVLNALLPFPWLKQISLLHAGIGDDGVMVICEFIQQYAPHAERNPFGIELLELPGNDVGPKGAGYLGKLLTQNETVKTLLLDFNPIGDQGAQDLGEGLKWNSTLSKLSLQYAQIGEAGGEAMARLVVRASSVRDLSLRGNPLQPRGVIHISRSLAKNAYLTRLDLADTSFGVDLEAVEALRDGIEANESLESVDINFNSLVPVGAALFKETLIAKPKLTQFVIYERLDSAVFSQLMEQVANNVKNAKRAGKKKPKPKSAAASVNVPAPPTA